ncbi:MAG TPA: MBL fold metallo-hydrolase [Phycisphaerales bacterium]|jgi:phosphoribosyl 1,2-cyclic phosphate phosphodiesterase|nr:MBL fold metallo-hydrolase [Phycisphaerales bacterium]
MRFTFLGTGTSSGVPAIACDCPVCTSADPRDNRLRTGAALEFVDPRGQLRTILLDCTPDLRQQALRANLRRCDAVLFTHNHVDHTFGVDELRRFNVVQNAPIEIYAEASVMEHLRRVYKHIFESERNVNKSFVATLIPFIIDPDKPIDLLGLRITPIRLLHGRLPILGFRIERAVNRPGEDDFLPLAYCTDVSAIPPESWAKLRGVRTLVLDALRKRHHPTHFTIDQAIAAAQQIGAERTLFVHITHDLGHAQTSEELPEGIELAYDGLSLGSLTLEARAAKAEAAPTTTRLDDI